MWSWATYIPLCQYGVFQSSPLCFNRVSWESGHAPFPWADQVNLPSTLFFFFFKFQNKHRKDSRNSSISCGADLKGMFKVYTPNQQGRAWRHATSPSVQQTAQNLTAPHEDHPTSYSLLLFLLLLASIPCQVFRWLFLLGLATCTSISPASLSICLLENCLLCPFLPRDSSTWPEHLWSLFGKTLLPLPADPILSGTICLPPALTTFSPKAWLSLVTSSNTTSSLG